MRADLLDVADLFRAHGITLQLLTSGLALEKMAPGIAARFSEVTISLDGHTPDLYRAIRGVNGLEAVAAGVRRLRALAPQILIRARSTIHRHNFRFLDELIAKSAEMGLDQISLLAADVTSESFNRAPMLPVVAAIDQERQDARPGLILSAAETDEMETIVENVIRERAREIAERRVVPGPEGLRRLVAYYRAHLGAGPFPAVACSAPWASIVIEASGAVRPCFFHAPVGNLRERPLDELVTRAMPAFRRTLDVASNDTCQRCVCTLKVGLRTKLW